MGNTTVLKEFWPETCHERGVDPEYEEGLVSVIIPTYNRAEMVTDAMDSVWNQTYRPIELIVVDDGSTDNTSEVIGRWEEEYGKVDGFKMLYFQQENRGAPAARNRGAAISRGEFLLWHDSDDLMLDRRVELAVEKLNQTSADACLCGFTSEGRTYRQSSFLPDEMLQKGNEAFLSGDIYFSTVIWMFRRTSLLAANPWREYLVRCQDQFFIESYLLAENVPLVTSLCEYLCYVRSGDCGIHVHRRNSYEDFEGQLRYLESILAELKRRECDYKIIRKIAQHAAQEAVYSYHCFPELSSRFLALVNRYAPDANWGDAYPHFRKILWKLGGRCLCNIGTRVFEFAARLQG
jgi:glycosyltransferase involved in cell wall biosynthesis